MKGNGYILILLLFVTAGSIGESGAQNFREVDGQWLRSIYTINDPVFSSTMSAADRLSIPAFASVPFGFWAVGLTVNDRSIVADAYLLTVSEGITLLATVGLKRLTKRPRPYVVNSDIVSKKQGHGIESRSSLHSFPSGHTSLSFALATSVTYISRAWYISVPAYIGASAVGLSRIWHGVHYPFDVLAGATLGTLITVAVFTFRDHLLPDNFKTESEDGPGVTVPFLVVNF